MFQRTSHSVSTAMEASPHYLPQEIIAMKRDGHALDATQLRSFVDGATLGTWADYQLSALLMAIFIRGMDSTETAILTDLMMRSGVVADLSSVLLPKVDKHSTGGVGDKISLPLAPLVAACGVAVPMISGRGLGHTGGTLDKLEAIPGFRTGLSLVDYRRQMERLGVALIGQTDELAPADRKLYALRDVTSTVECIPLICASILSKKLAEGLDSLVLDVKFGRGAFMKEQAQARILASAMVEVAQKVGKPTRALLTSMDQPLGRAVGNAVEVAESIECLKGRGPSDVMALCYALGSEMLLLARVVDTAAQARAKLEAAVASGAALEKFARIIEAQGGDPRVIERPEAFLPQAAVSAEVVSQESGYVADVDPMAVAMSALRLGAGRTKAEQGIDPSVGIDRLCQRGDAVVKGSVLARVLASSQEAAERAACEIRSAIRISAARPDPVELIAEIL